MRTALAVLTVFLALPTAAQVEAPSPPVGPGLYGEYGIGGGYSSSSGGIKVTKAAVGYRLDSGVSLGVYGVTGHVGTEHSSFSVGPEVRYSRPLDSRTRLDLYASSALGAYRGPALDASALRVTGVGTQVGGSATRRFALGRGVTFAATGGLYGGVGQRFGHDDVEGGLQAQAGLIVGAQVEFKVLGATVGIGPRGAIPLVRTGSGLGFGADVHNAGGGPGGGFLSIRF